MTSNMRAIWFRAWVLKDDIFEGSTEPKMFTGFDFADIESGHAEANVFCGDDIWREPNWDRAIIMQYTGLKDKNGVEIYEGDIIGIVDDWIGEVIYKPPRFEIETRTLPEGIAILFSGFTVKNANVIGNIYENPKLLEGKQ